MAQGTNYQVTYDIVVNDCGTAAIKQFTNAVKDLHFVGQQLRSVNGVPQKFNDLAKSFNSFLSVSKEFSDMKPADIKKQTESITTIAKSLSSTMGELKNVKPVDGLSKVAAQYKSMAKRFSEIPTVKASAATNVQNVGDAITKLSGVYTEISRIQNTYKGVDIAGFTKSVGGLFKQMQKIKIDPVKTANIQGAVNAMDGMVKIAKSFKGVANELEKAGTTTLRTGSQGGKVTERTVEDMGAKFTAMANSIGVVSDAMKKLSFTKNQMTNISKNIKHLQAIKDIAKELKDTHMAVSESIQVLSNGKGTPGVKTSYSSPLNMFADGLRNLAGAVGLFGNNSALNTLEALKTSMKELSSFASSKPMVLSIDTSAAVTSLQEVLALLGTIESGMNSVNGGKGTGKKGSRKAQGTTTIVNPIKTPGDDGNGGDGSGIKSGGGPTNLSGFQVFGGGSVLYKGKGITGGGPMKVLMASAGGAGGSGGSVTPPTTPPTPTLSAWAKYMNLRPTALGFGASVNPRDYRNWLKNGVRQFGPDMLTNRSWSNSDMSAIQSLLSANQRLSRWASNPANLHSWWGERGLISMARNSFTRYGQMVEDPYGTVDVLGQRSKYFEPGRVEALRMIRESIAAGKVGPSMSPFFTPTNGVKREIPTMYKTLGWLSKKGLKWKHGMAKGSNWHAGLWDAPYIREATARMLQESEAILEAHRAFNAQLAENYHRAVAEAGGGAGAVGGGAYNQFNKIGNNTSPTTDDTALKSRLAYDRVMKNLPMWSELNRARRIAASKVRPYDPTLQRAIARNVPHPTLKFNPSTGEWVNVSSPLPYRRSAASYEAWWNNALDERQRNQKNAQELNKFQTREEQIGKNRISGRYLSKKFSKSIIPKNIGYKVLGPSMLDSGGLGITSMLKGMGVMYGITGATQLLTNTFKDYVDYNNIMQTTMNILRSHDTGRFFGDRFANMAHTIRKVGIETKFTAPEVADAAKFLAMAGYKIPEINAAISPIADIALVGDTELGTTADLMTNVMTAYGIKPEYVRQAADIMTNTFTMSNTTLTEMAEAYKYSAGLLAANGVSFQESAAALGILGNAGIKGSQAGTTMRTIMANLRKPTKNQAGSWTFKFKNAYDQDGIKTVKNANGENVYTVNRTDANGNVRNLVDIFGELSSVNNLLKGEGGPGVNAYNLFHKTAAQGAMALMAQVEQWNNIINENFFSDGMVKKLADAKKNTISGLWSQLTSMFTENGIRSFSKLDSAIRNILGKAIDAIDPTKSSSFGGVMDKTVGLMQDLLGTVSNVTQMIYTMSTRFGGFVTSFMKLQMYAMPFLFALRGMKGVTNAGMGLIGMASAAGRYTSGIGSLAMYGMNSGSNYRGFRFGNNRFKPKDFFRNINLSGTKVNDAEINDYYGTRMRLLELQKENKPLPPDLVARKNALEDKWMTNDPKKLGQKALRMRELRLLAMRRQSIIPFTTGAGSIAGLMMGGKLGADIATSMGAEEGGFAQTGGALLGMLGGSALLGSLGGQVGTMIAAFPWASALIVASTIALFVGKHFYDAHKKMKSFMVDHKKFLEDIRGANGVTASDSASLMDKHLQALMETQKGLNEEKSAYIKLLLKERGLINDTGNGDSKASLSDVSPFWASKVGEIRDNGYNLYQALESYDENGNKKNFIQLSNGALVSANFANNKGSFAEISRYYRGSDLVTVRDYSQLLANNNPNAILSFSTSHGNNRVSAANAEYYMGYDLSNNGIFSKDYQQLLKKAMQAENMSEVRRLFSADIASRLAQADPKSLLWDMDQIDKPGHNPEFNLSAINGFSRRLFDVLFNPENKHRQVIEKSMSLRKAVLGKSPNGKMDQSLFGPMNAFLNALGVQADSSGNVFSTSSIDKMPWRGFYESEEQYQAYKAHYEDARKLVLENAPWATEWFRQFVDTLKDNGNPFFEALNSRYIDPSGNEQSLMYNGKNYQWVRSLNKYVNEKYLKFNSPSSSWSIIKGKKVPSSEMFDYGTGFMYRNGGNYNDPESELPSSDIFSWNNPYMLNSQTGFAPSTYNRAEPLNLADNRISVGSGGAIVNLNVYSDGRATLNGRSQYDAEYVAEIMADVLTSLKSPTV